MYLHQIATSLPQTSYTQEETWDIFRNSSALERLRPGSIELVRKVLRGENGITRRHFALSDLENLLAADSEDLNRAFEREAPALAERSLATALERGNWYPNELDFLAVCTCTGYLCPGLSSFIAERMGMRPDAVLLDVVGQGCGAAIPAHRAAAGFLASNPDARAAVVAVEVCTAAFYLENDAGVLVSFCIFGDGAAASLWKGKAGDDAWRADRFDTLHFPEDRQMLRFENRRGFLRNRLHPEIPRASSTAVKALYDRSISPETLPDALISHGGGKHVLNAIRERLGGYSLDEAERVLNSCGNMSSPSVMFALEEHLSAAPDTRHLWLTSFGAGFSVHGMHLTR